MSRVDVIARAVTEWEERHNIEPGVDVPLAEFIDAVLRRFEDERVQEQREQGKEFCSGPWWLAVFRGDSFPEEEK